jgi:hypothetical protein
MSVYIPVQLPSKAEKKFLSGVWRTEMLTIAGQKVRWVYMPAKDWHGLSMREAQLAGKPYPTTSPPGTTTVPVDTLAQTYRNIKRLEQGHKIKRRKKR